MPCCSLLLGNTESLTSTTSRLCLLTSDLYAEEVTETSVLTSLLHALQVFSESGVNHVGNQLRVGTVFDASLSVEEPLWDTIFWSY